MKSVYIWRLHGADVRRLPDGKQIWKIGVSTRVPRIRASAVARGLGGTYDELIHCRTAKADLIEEYLLYKFTLRPKVSFISQGWSELRLLDEDEATFCKAVILAPPNKLGVHLTPYRKNYRHVLKLHEMISEMDLSQEKVRKAVIRKLEAAHGIDLSDTIAGTTIKVPRGPSTKPLPVSWREVCWRRCLRDRAMDIGANLGEGKPIKEPYLDIKAGLKALESYTSVKSQLGESKTFRIIDKKKFSKVETEWQKRLRGIVDASGTALGVIISIVIILKIFGD